MTRKKIEQADGSVLHVSGWSGGEVPPGAVGKLVEEGNYELRIGDGKLGNDWHLIATRGEVVRICHAMLSAVGATRVDMEFCEFRPTLFVNGSSDLSSSPPGTVERQSAGSARVVL